MIRYILASAIGTVIGMAVVTAWMTREVQRPERPVPYPSLLC